MTAAAVHGNLSKLYAQAVDLTSSMRDLESSAAAAQADSTVLGSSSESHVDSPVIGATLKGDGIFDGTLVTGPVPGGAHAAITTALGQAGSLLVHCLNGDFEGADAHAMQGTIDSYVVKAMRGDVMSASIAATSVVGLDAAKVLHALTAETAGGNGAGTKDVAAPTTNGGVGYLQVMAMAGTTPSVTVKVQHAVDVAGSPGAWVDLITFAACTAAPSANAKQRIALAAGTTVNPWRRVLWTLSGTGGPSATFHLAFGRK